MTNCNFSTLVALVAAAHLHLLGAIGLIAAAVVLNASFFGAPASVALMASAASVALTGLGPVVAAFVNGFSLRRDCLRHEIVRKNCAGHLDTILALLGGVLAGFAIVPVALAAAVLVAGVPWVGAAAMTAAATVLAGMLGLLIAIDVALARLIACARTYMPNQQVMPTTPQGIEIEALTCPAADSWCDPTRVAQLVPAQKLGPTRFEVGPNFALTVRATAAFRIVQIVATAHQDSGPRNPLAIIAPGDPQGLPDRFVVPVSGTNLNFTWGVTGVPSVVQVLLICKPDQGSEQSIWVQCTI